MKKSNLPSVLMSAAGMLWLGVFPLWQDLSYSRITRAKWLGMLVLCGVTLAVVLAALLAGRNMLRRPHWPRALAAGYFAWVGASALFGRLAATVNAQGQPAVWMGAIRYEGMATQLCYLTIFLCMGVLALRPRAVMHAAAGAVLVFCGIVVLQYVGMNPLGLFPGKRSIMTNYEFQGTIGNIDMVSGYLSLVTPLLLAGYALAGKPCRLWLVSGVAGVWLECCMEVQSGLIAMAVLAVLLVMLLLHRPESRPRCLQALGGMLLALALRLCLHLPWLDGGKALVAVVTLPVVLLAAASAALFVLAARPAARGEWALSGRQVLLGAVCLVLAAVVGVAVLPIPRSMGGLWEMHELLQGRGQDAFGSGRLGVWRHTLAMAAQSPLVGNGPDTFLYAMQAYLTDHGLTLAETFDNPHNEYLAILVNNGIPALGMYLALLAGVLLRCLRRGKNTPWLWTVGAAILCYGVQGFFSFSICIVSPMFWAVMGMACAPDDANGMQRKR